MIYVSEDKESATIAKGFVEVVYPDGKLYYTNGCSNYANVVKGILEENKDNQEEIILYIDYGPNNSIDRKFFKVLKIITDDYKRKNCYLVPIISTEYCVFLSMIALGCYVKEDYIKVLKGNLDYRELKTGERTLEQSLKVMLKNTDITFSFCNSKFYVNFDGKFLTFEERAVNFIASHVVYLDSNIIKKYFGSDKSISKYDLKSYFNDFINFRGKLYEAEGKVNYINYINKNSDLLERYFSL